MSEKTWEVIKLRYCHHVDREVGLEVEVVYPPEFMPDQPPRVFAHRCTHAIACNLDGRPSCLWAGTNPVIEPFFERL